MFTSFHNLCFVSLHFAGKPLKVVNGKLWLEVEAKDLFITVFILFDRVVIDVSIGIDATQDRWFILNVSPKTAATRSEVWNECQKILDKVEDNDFSDFPNPIMADRLFHRSPDENQPVSEWLKGATTAQDYVNKARELSKALIG